MKIAAAAYPIDWHNRWNDYVGKLRVWVRTAAEQGAELLVFPEYGGLELASLAGEDNARDLAAASTRSLPGSRMSTSCTAAWRASSRCISAPRRGRSNARTAGRSTGRGCSRRTAAPGSRTS